MSEAKQETKTKAAAKKEAVQKETVMYIGPSIKNVVATGTLYNNGLPDALKDEMERQPIIGNLIIPVGSLAAAQKELAKAGSALSIMYGKVITG